MAYKIILMERDGKIVLRYQRNDHFGTFAEEVYEKKHDIEDIARAIGIALQLDTLVSK